MLERFSCPSQDTAAAAGERSLTALRPSQQPPDLAIERLERALVLLAYFIEVDGDVHIPLYEKLEAELAAMRQREDTRVRARERLAAYVKGRRPKGDALEEF